MAKENEILKCNCEDDRNHISYQEDKNGETVIECTTCGRFLKFPKHDDTEYEGNAKEVTAEELQEIKTVKKPEEKEKQIITPDSVGRLEDVLGKDLK